MKIYDCFLFFDEDIQLDIRLNVLNQYVDKFVIVESKFTHSGEKREPKFNLQKFKKFESKIEYFLIDSQPENLHKIKENDSKDKEYEKKILNGNIREFYQRNAIMKGIKNASPDDYIIISDVDEIPNLEGINFSKIKNKYLLFNQIFTCYKLNLFCKDMKWHGSRMTKKKHLIIPQWLRDIKGRKGFNLSVKLSEVEGFMPLKITSPFLKKGYLRYSNSDLHSPSKCCINSAITSYLTRIF